MTILLMTFALFLVVTGAFTAYFGSGKSRKIGAGLLGGGVVIAVFWIVTAGFLNMFGPPPPDGPNLGGIILEAFLVLVAAIIGAVAAIGLFLLAIMKS